MSGKRVANERADVALAISLWMLGMLGVVVAAFIVWLFLIP